MTNLTLGWQDRLPSKLLQTDMDFGFWWEFDLYMQQRRHGFEIGGIPFPSSSLFLSPSSLRSPSPRVVPLTLLGLFS